MRFCKFADTVISKLDIIFNLLRNCSRSRFDFFGTDDNIALVLIQFGRVFLGFGLTSSFDLGQHLGNDFAGVCFGAGSCFAGLF